jgi:hypothetical protein
MYGVRLVAYEGKMQRVLVVERSVGKERVDGKITRAIASAGSATCTGGDDDVGQCFAGRGVDYAAE